MKFRHILFPFLVVALVAPAHLRAASPTAAAKGRIYIQTESYGRAWYVAPHDGARYYLKGGREIVRDIGTLALGISERDFALIPERAGAIYDRRLVERLKGYFILRVGARGEIWYVHPTSGLRYPLRTPGEAQAFLSKVGMPISNAVLVTAPMNTRQLMFDPAMKQPVAARLDNGVYVDGQSADTIRPLASLTKLMTALVLTDIGLDQSAPVTITASHIAYPRDLVGDDATSEVDLEVGDTVTVRDLWIAMLVASSNQSTVALVDHTGLGRDVFVERMNEKAATLGLTHTKFYDVAGLDSHNVSTAKEMALIAGAAFAEPRITTASSTINYTFMASTPSGGTRNVTVTDRNYSLRAFGADAAKTGYLVEAQRNVALKKGNTILVVMNAQSMSQRNELLTKLWPK